MDQPRRRVPAVSGLGLHMPRRRVVLGRRARPRRPIELAAAPSWLAWALAVVAAAVAAGILVTLAALPAFETEPAIPWWLVALLFGAAEAAAFQIHVRGHVAAVALRGTPLLLGLFFLTPVHLVVASVVGVALALAVRRRSSATAAALVLATAAAGTAAGALVFQAMAAIDSDSPFDLWGAASVAALCVAAASVLARAPVRSPDGVRGGPDPLAAALVAACGIAVVDGSLGMAVVLHARNDPAELWLLAGPTVLAVLAYRAYGSLRRRQARLEFLYECGRILDGPATGPAMLVALLERTKEMLHAETAEIIVDGGTGRPVRTVVGQAGTLETLTTAPVGCLSCVLALIPPDADGVLVHPGGPAGSSDSSAHGSVTHGVLVRLRGGRGVVGAISVTGRTDGGRFDKHDLRLLEALAANVGTAMDTRQLMDELATSLADASRLAALVSSSDDAIIGFTPERVVTSWNAAAETLFGYPAGEIIGGAAPSLVPEDRRADLGEAFDRACAGTQVRDLQVDARRRDGTLVPVSATISPIRDAQGTVTGISVIARDETERTLQESALRQSADRFRSVFEGSSVGMGVIDANLRWVRVNEALCRTLRTTETALVGRRFELLLHRDDISSAHGLVRRLIHGESPGATVEMRFRAPDDDRNVVTAFTVRPLREGGSTLQVLCMVEDVTDRRLAEEQAKETESRLHRAVLDLTAVREPVEVMRATLRAARSVSGAESAAIAVLGADGVALADLVIGDGDLEPDDIGVLLGDELTAALAGATGGPIRLPLPGTGRDRRPLVGPLASLRSYLAMPIRFEGRTLAILHLGNRRGGAGFTDLDIDAAAVLAAQAGISLENARIHERALTLVRDLDRTNTALQEASETRARILASVSHELRTPLHSILVAAQLVRDSMPERGTDRRVRELGTTIEGSGRHLLGLIDDFVDLSRIEVGAFELRPIEVSLGQLLAEVRRDMAPLAAEKGISLAIAQARGVRAVADPLRLRQVLINLLSNAVKFTPRGGRVRVSVHASDDGLWISVHDTGIGIAPGDVERAFQPFQQVSGTDTPGVGLGLAISRRIVELHGGTLTAASVLGTGSTFTVAMPASSPPQAASGLAAAEPVTPEPGPGRRVRVVEDDETAA